MTTSGSYTKSGMYFERIGEGSPVVLLHGWCLSGAMWLYEVDQLRQHYEVIVPDLIGFGRSSGAPGPYTLERYVAALAELIAEARCEGCAIVGFAFGADIALAATAKSPNGVRRVEPSGLVLAGITSGADFPDDRMIRGMRRDWPLFARRSAEVLTQGKSEATTAWLERIYSQSSLSVAVDAAEILGRFNPTDYCADLEVPTLFLHGAQDEVAPVAVAKSCAEQARSARLAVLDDARHFVVLDQPGVFHDEVSGFLRSLAGSPSVGAAL